MKNIYLVLWMFIMAVLGFSCDDEEQVEIPFLKVELEDGQVNVLAADTVVQVEISTNLAEFSIVPEAQDGYEWCSVCEDMGLEGKRLLTFTVASNEELEQREAVFVIAGQGVETIRLNVVQLGTAPNILSDVKARTISPSEQNLVIKITANIPYEVSNRSTWLSLQSDTVTTRGMAVSELHYLVQANTGLATRYDTIQLQGNVADTLITLQIPIQQEMGNLDNVLADDIKLEVTEAKLVQGKQYKDYSPDRTIDGELRSTGFASDVVSEPKNVIIDYTMKQDVGRVDYIKLHQYASASVKNGNYLTSGRLFYKSETVEEWTPCGTFDVNGEGVVPSLMFDVGVQNPLQFRLELDLTSAGKVTLGEFECYQLAEENRFDLVSDAQYFADGVFSKLKEGVTQEDVKKITHPIVRSVAQELLNKVYSTEFRSRTYHSCKNPSWTETDLSIGKRSVCDNPTGLFFRKDREYVVFVSGKGESDMKLYLKDWRKNGKEQTFSLKEGVNMLCPQVNGMGYVQYWSETDEPLPDVHMHVCFGNEIGFWDLRAGHTDKDWNRILSMASSNSERFGIADCLMEVLGNHVQLINTVQVFNEYCPDNIEEFVETYDKVLQSQYTMMGLDKNQVVLNNRLLGIPSWSDNISWNGTGVLFPNEGILFDKENQEDGIWLCGEGFAYANCPQCLKIPGFEDVIGKVYAQETLFQLMGGHGYLENEMYKRPESSKGKFGDRFNEYLNRTLVNGEDYFSLEDAYMRFVPFWQLSLFFTKTDGNTPWHKADFWLDLIWQYMTSSDSNEDYGIQYVNLMKKMMDLTGFDLSDFLEKSGLLREVEMKIGDKRIIITETMVNDVKQYGNTKIPVPESASLHYISGNSLEVFNNRLSVQGRFGEGISKNGTSMIVSHGEWKNAVAYETYAGNILVDVSICGTGTTDNSATQVHYPIGATRVEAVSWNGERTLVYGER